MIAMISQPMGGLTDAEINRERERITDILANDHISVVETRFSFPPFIAKNMGLYCLAKSIEAMANVDLVYFCRGWKHNRGCRIEYYAAIEYGLPVFIESSSD